MYDAQHNFYGKESLCDVELKPAEGNIGDRIVVCNQLVNDLRQEKPKKRKKPKKTDVSQLKSNEVEVKFAKPTRVNTLKPLLMPKTFDEQIQSDDIFKRFKTM